MAEPEEVLPAGPALPAQINGVDGVPPLKNAEREATAVSGLLDADTCLLAEAASRANVINELPGVGVLHLACHAVARQADVAGSHLILQDARLSVDDLLAAELPLANLAYLSACSTALALGTDEDEVGTLHIAAAFQAAGFPNVIGTLWPVSDAGAQKLAIDVHHQIANGVTPAHALHAAVRAARDAYRARPELWSPYLHYGP